MSLLLLILAGCGGDPETEVCDTNTYICDTAAYWERQNLKDATWDDSEGTYIDIARLPSCDGDGNWTYSARTKGWTAAPLNRINSWTRTRNEGATDEVLGWNEEHTLDVLGSDPNGTWDELGITLVTVDNIAEVDPGSRTALECGVHDVQPLMTYVLRVFDPNGNLADCAIFSTETNAQSAISEVLSGQREAPVPITNGQQINATNCIVWN